MWEGIRERIDTAVDVPVPKDVATSRGELAGLRHSRGRRPCRCLTHDARSARRCAAQFTCGECIEQAVGANKGVERFAGGGQAVAVGSLTAEFEDEGEGGRVVC